MLDIGIVVGNKFSVCNNISDFHTSISLDLLILKSGVGSVHHCCRFHSSYDAAAKAVRWQPSSGENPTVLMFFFSCSKQWK